MKSKKNNGYPIPKKLSPEYDKPKELFPRPICLEKCTLNTPKGYEGYIISTLKAFSNEIAYNRKFPHKLEGSNTWSLDVKSRNDKYRMLFQIDNNVCKIFNLCTTETH